MKKLAVLFVSLFVIGCGAGEDINIGVSQRPIVNGEVVNSNEIPSVCFLRMVRSNGIFICTGSLIGETHILTAAHCVHDALSIQVSCGGQVRAANTYTEHQGYVHGELGINDIAVIEVASPYNNIYPIPLANREPSLFEPIVIVGYGITRPNGEGGGTLRIGSTFVTDISKSWIEMPAVSMKTSGVCNGDSGGPSFAMREDDSIVQSGVHSHGAVDCLSGGWDMRVDAYIDWIISATDGDVVYEEPLPEEPLPEEPYVPIDPSNDPDDEDNLDEGGCSISSSENYTSFFLTLLLFAFFVFRKMK